MTQAEREAIVNEGFVQGVAWAAGVLVSLHDRPTIAKDILQQTGFPLSAFSVAFEEDLALLRPEIPDLPHGRE